MPTFPTLIPSSRTFTPGEYPNTAYTAWSGMEGRVRHSNVMLSSSIRLSFLGLTEAQMLSILSHYQGQLGSFSSFDIPDEVVSGLSILDLQLIGYSWRYADPPQVEDLSCGGHNVEVVLESIPPEGAAVSGLDQQVLASLVAGDVAVSNGITTTISISISAGATTVAADGITATIAASLSAGAASGA